MLVSGNHAKHCRKRDTQVDECAGVRAKRCGWISCVWPASIQHPLHNRACTQLVSPRVASISPGRCCVGWRSTARGNQNTPAEVGGGHGLANLAAHLAGPCGPLRVACQTALCLSHPCTTWMVLKCRTQRHDRTSDTLFYDSRKNLSIIWPPISSWDSKGNPFMFELVPAWRLIAKFTFTPLGRHRRQHSSNHHAHDPLTLAYFSILLSFRSTFFFPDNGLLGTCGNLADSRYSDRSSLPSAAGPSRELVCRARREETSQVLYHA